MPNNTIKLDASKFGQKILDMINIFRNDILDPTEYFEEFVYFLFLKLFDIREKEREEIAKAHNINFVPDLPNHLMFSNWAKKILESDGDIVEIENGKFTIIEYIQNIFDEMSKVENHNGRDLSLFRWLFKNHKCKIQYNQTIKELITQLYNIEFEKNFDIIGQSYEVIIKEFNKTNQYGQYFTPAHIAHFMVDLANPEIGEKIYDPAAGTCPFIVRSFEIIKNKIINLITTNKTNQTDLFNTAQILFNQLKNDSLYAVEKDPNVYKLAVMNILLYNDGKSNIYEADSLDEYSQILHKEKYNIILSNPPYGPVKEIHSGIFEYYIKRYEALFMQHIMNALKQSENDKKRSRAVVIILDKILYDNSSAFINIRKKLLREYNLKVIFSMPAGIFQPYTKVKTSILYFEKPTKEEFDKIQQTDCSTKQILFVDIQNDGFTLTTKRQSIDGSFQGNTPNIYNPPCGDLPKAIEIFKKWNNWIDTKSENIPDFIDNVFCWTATIDDIKAHNYSLVPKVYKKKIQTNQKWKLVPLKEVLTSLEIGKRPRGGVSNIRNGIPSIGGEHIDISGTLKLDNIRYIPEEFFNTFKQGIIEDNNILMVKDGIIGKIAYINKLPFEKAVINEHVFLLKVNTEKMLPKFLFYVLYSNYGQNQIKMCKRGSIISGITKDILDNIQIPVPPLHIQKKIIEHLDKLSNIIESRNIIDNIIFEIKNDTNIA